MDVLCDASVVVKWFASRREPELAESRAIARAGEQRLTLRVLELTHLEVANVMLRKKGMPGERVGAILDRLLLIAGEPHRATFTQLRLATGLADGHGLSVYDALYWAVAERTGRSLVTADAALLGAGAGESPSQLCERLGIDPGPAA